MYSCMCAFARGTKVQKSVVFNHNLEQNGAFNLAKEGSF